MDENPCKNIGRGYYSEIIINQDDAQEQRLSGAYKRTKLLWQIRTDGHSPIIPNIDASQKISILAPATRWTSFPEEKLINFPVDTFKPIVQMQHHTEPFKLPRNVAIERLRRQYQGKGIKQYLDKVGIQPRDMLPVYILQKILPRTERFGLYRSANFLPLEIFDDEEYDSRTPQSWLQHGILDGIKYPIPGEAFLPISAKSEVPAQATDSTNYLYEWVNVSISDYNPTLKLWTVTTLDGLLRQFKIPRINLMFKAEDPENFMRRIQAAINLRNETESRIKYELYLDCMLAVGTEDIASEWITSICYWARRGKLHIKVEYYVEKLVKEIQLSYQRCMFELHFLELVKQEPYTYKFLTVPKKVIEKVPAKGKFETGLKKNFNDMRAYFKWSSIYVYPQAYRGMAFIHIECMKIEDYNLFSTAHGKSVLLDEFEAMQTHVQITVIRSLQTDWLQKIASITRVAFGDLGKGWYDMSEKIYGIYDISKLHRFNQAVLHRMQYSLRVMVQKSAESFANLVASPCILCLPCEEDLVWTNDFITSPYKSQHTALFNITLKMNDDGAFYSQDPHIFGKTLISIFDATIRVSHTIKQVHPMYLPNLKFPEGLCLSSLGLLSEYVCELRDKIELGFRKAIIPLFAYAKAYDSHIPLFTLDVQEYIDKYLEDNHTASEYKDEIYNNFKMKESLELTLPSQIVIGPFNVIVEPLKQFFVNKRQELAQKLLDQFARKMSVAVNEVVEEYVALNMKLDEKPTSIEHIYELKEWLETVPMVVRGFDENIKRYVLEYEVLDYFWYNLTDDDFENKWLAVGWPYKLLKHIDLTNELLIEETDKYYKIQMSDEMVLEEKIEGLTVQVTNMSLIRDFTRIHETAVDIRRVWKGLKEAQEQGQLLNQRQKLFLVPVVPFDTITKLIKEFEPYKNLWVTASDWLKQYEIWMDNPLVNIDETMIELTLSDMYKTMIKSIKIFSEIPAVASVAAELRNQMDDFRPLIPIIQSVRNPGMKERHWEELYNATGVQINWTPNLTFNDCLVAGIQNVADDVCKISESASKEFTIEQTLDRMEEDWENNMLDMMAYKNTGTFIMRVADEIQQMLDDHIILTQQISFSPYKAAFDQRIDEWELKLRLTFDVIEEWIEVQRQWMYLEPIFTSEDIANQLPFETKKYKAVDRAWRRIMRNANDCPKMLIICPDKALLEALKDANHMLEVVQKGLADYLEYKRSIFPRLFFLSDDELLEILAQARNPLAVQPHLRKCFENIAKLTFEEDLHITQMYSAEEECVDLRPTLYPVGSVENWLLVVEDCMRNTLRTTFGDALADIYEKDRKEWVLNWPGQIVIAGSQTFWTAGVETGLNTDTMKDFFVVLLEHLDALRSLVKGSLSYLKREVLSALIVIEVHARDVTQVLVDTDVKNINDFAWISQLRYYWIEDNIKVRAVNAEFPYGYEYLGNSGRLVITPLTDRCYLTLTGALHLKFGGAPAGPAGTGKTETTKDLAKAFARQCVVFNCSDQLDFMAMGKFFKGLASSGAWACFDEFNRIDIEVLSVIAQQIMTIQKAQQARLERFLFEGSEIALKDSCAVFITMNPGYAGRTELPDNLKALFRPVAMMIPDYTLIAEISLFSFGFGNAKQLANKITTTFKLSSEQLSSQDHYDFGMRAVKTVIAVAGNLKRERPQMEEKQIVLRALRDVNVPKFLRDDLKLFNGIVTDLFPRMVEETIDYGILEASIRQSSIKMGLEDVDDYVKKVIQLYETTVVRHGLMLVGPTGSGKTKCYEILRAAMTAVKGQPSPSGSPFQPVHTYVLNPKSITMGQLYGEFDLQTHEWTDGILPCLVRIGVSAETKDKRWYVFDGPVDAVWIENMNTVLDDNKKLCLSSGEIIKLRDTQTMMFEVADLAVASPATVSRCGMVYLEPSVLGLQPFVNCWTNRLPNLAVPYVEEFLELIGIYLYPALELLRSSMKEILTSVDSALVLCFLRLIDYFLMPLSGKDNRPPPPPQFQKLIPDLLVPWITFSLTWSVGATCDYGSRIVFSNWLRERMAENRHEPRFPIDGLVYDYKLHDGGFTVPTADGEPAPPKWLSWMDKMEEYAINIDMKYSDIEIPTIDYVRSAELLGMLLLNENNVLSVGPTGTGKTLTVSAKLNRNMHKKFICDFISFSARTSANQTQDLIDSKLDRRRKGVFGPPLLKRQVFFIDDFNMPALEVYGAQPPIELIRQWMDFGGWYDRKSVGEFRKIIDVNFVAAMGPPGGGRNPVTARLLRHYHYIAFTDMQDASKKTIFGTILKFWLNRTEGFAGFAEILLSTTIDVYGTILRELLPTPAKTHYTFNLRDLSKVFQGILMFRAEQITSVHEIIRLWYHECCRVYQDRLVNEADRKWFDELLRNRITTNFRVDPTHVLGDDLLLYGDFIDPSTDQKDYVNMTDMQQISASLQFYLDEYNNQTTRPMNLVLFLDAIAHLCRITRIIRQPMGNALLLGMGGSGRQSLTRLAAFISEFFSFQIELSKTYGMLEWREDVKKLLLKAGLQMRECVFLFSDTQIKTESFLEDLNNILNSGNVPNIYQLDELDSIYQGMKGKVQEQGLAATKSNLFSCYQKEVRSNLHCVISMSPIGEIFRARLRQFPALVNCCTIDWFSAWPDSALQSVALHTLKDVRIEMGISEEILRGIVVVFQFMHASVVEASDKFLMELSRHNYVTPTSYLELLNSYSDLILKKKGALIKGAARLKTGLEKLQTTSLEVKILQEELTVLKPALEVAAADAEVMIAQIAKDTLVAEETMAIVEKEEAVATKKAEETHAIAADAQKDLDAALPALEAAESSLKALNKNDITEVRTMQRPPAGVRVVIEAICIVKGIKPNRVPGVRPGEKINDYWEPGRAMLGDPNAFLNSLMNFDKDSITEDMINKLNAYVNDPSFEPAKIAKVSKACTSLCMWIHAMYKYYFVNMAVMPKKMTLAKAKEDLAATERALAIAKARLKIITDRLNDLNAKLDAKISFKNEQERNINVCMERMARAVRLINGLAEERLRWIDTIKLIEASQVNVIGDILISAGCVAYLTPFTDQYRRNLLDEWKTVVARENVPHTENCTPVSVLGEPIVIRQWQLDGLPRDALSTENAVLVSCSKRWPLFIDPQGQANKWVKNTGKERGIIICKLADRDLIRNLESAIRFGKPVLIENVGKELDPALDPILNRQVFKQGSMLMIKLGDTVLPYNEDFQLFITTKLPNPHYTPEVSIKVLLVNFTLVPSGLQDQLLALVVMQERPDLEEQRSAIIVSVAQMKQELKEIQDRILYKLSVSEGSPVDDIEFIITLEASKVKSEDIKNKVEAAEITQIDIEHTRAQYIPVANRGQILFFCVSDLANIDPMYQYSLEWFINIFIASMATTQKTDNLEERVRIINDHFTFSLYSNVCRSLFEKHKLHFAFLMCVRILMDDNKIDGHEWHHFLAGGSPKSELPNPASWLSGKSWREILSLEVLPNFQEFISTFASHVPKYKDIFESPEPHRMGLPEPINSQLDAFQKLIVLKCLRPDKVTNAMQDFLTEKLGARFVEPQTSDLSAMFKESSPISPLIFVLSTGTDPAASLFKFAEKMKMLKRLFTISLGQGQGPRAEKMIEEGSETGSWVFFQNCHLAPSWMPRLERLIETIPIDSVHKEFRIWLTSTPSPNFPVSILQNGSKMTVEPPRGVKANMLRAYLNEVADRSEYFHSNHEKVFTFKWLLFSLCLFHAAIIERRKFGPLGFNIPYEFTDGDLKICISQLHMFLLEYDEIPFKVLTYTAGHINYGGRVTDDWDRRCLLNILGDYYNMIVVSPNHSFDSEDVYHQLPGDTILTDYVEYIKSFPINDSPDLFGLHANADISCAQNLTNVCLQTLLMLQPKQVGGASASQEDITAAVANAILKEVPSSFNLEQISETYPVMYEESLNTVIVQEAIRYNKLLNVIRSSLSDLLKALKGLVVMSEALEGMAGSLFSNMVPTMWSGKAYPSLKPLGSWVEDLNARVRFLNLWVDNGIPPAFWISGFYFPQAFLTGTLQNYARKHVLSIDTIGFAFKVLDQPPTARPKDGCCIYGLFIEGARWNAETRLLDESRPKELYTDMPHIWLLPEEYHVVADTGVYVCPVYKTLTRAGTLSTTGHSTNFVLALEVPSAKEQKHWIKRGVALICALDY